MKRTGMLHFHYLSLWHSLLTGACIVLVWLAAIQISEGIGISSLFTYFNTDSAYLSWAPSQGSVDHYLLEITDTRLMEEDFGGGKGLTITRYATSAHPFYRLSCTHGHSYKVRVKAVSPAGIASEYSESSILFICDQKAPALELDSPPAPPKVRTQDITLSGSFDEPHLASLTVNGIPAGIDYQSGRFSATLSLSPGDNSVRFCARDLAGNTTTEHTSIIYAPITIISLPNSRVYWNGNYAYRGSFGGISPRSYHSAARHKQSLRISLAGYQDYCGVIDFSDLSQDTYFIPLLPHITADFTRLARIVSARGPSASFAPTHPFAVDYNLDGKKDLLVGNADGTISLFINRGTNAAPHLTEQFLLRAGGKPIDVGTDAAPFMVDYDNNGTADVLVGSGDGLLYYCKNKASNTAPAFASPVLLVDSHGIPIAVGTDCMPWIVDWNGDNKKDIMLGNGSGTLMLYLNQGSDRQPIYTSPRSLMAGGKEIQVDGPSAPCVVDWNADGQPDVLLGTGNGQITIYYAAPGGEAPVLNHTEAIELNGQPMMLGSAVVPFSVDWNDDGKANLLIGTGAGEVYLAL